VRLIRSLACLRDEGANVFNSPRCDVRPKPDGFREDAVPDPAPPSGSAHWDSLSGSDKLGNPDEALCRQLFETHAYPLCFVEVPHNLTCWTRRL
jgi:hypothetical protein